MQHAYSDFPRSQQEYEHQQKEHHLFEYESRIDAGEKILPPVRQKKHIQHLILRVCMTLLSLLVLIPVCALILFTPSDQVIDLTNLHLVFAIFGILSLNEIVYLLLTRIPWKPGRKGIFGRLVFAVITGFLTPVVCQMMISGENGQDGILLVWLIVINSNIISYLTLCAKRQKSSRDENRPSIARNDRARG